MVFVFNRPVILTVCVQISLRALNMKLSPVSVVASVWRRAVLLPCQTTQQKIIEVSDFSYQSSNYIFANFPSCLKRAISWLFQLLGVPIERGMIPVGWFSSLLLGSLFFLKSLFF